MTGETKLDYRNAQWVAPDVIDCEINFRGAWLPFSASPSDTQDYGRALFSTLADLLGPCDATGIPREPAPAPVLSRADFVVALTQTTPPILTEAEAMAALESFPPKFAAALADKPLAYRAAAIEAWRTTATVARDAPLFENLLAFYAQAAGMSAAQAAALGDAIFAGASHG